MYITISDLIAGVGILLAILLAGVGLHTLYKKLSDIGTYTQDPMYVSLSRVEYTLANGTLAQRDYLRKQLRDLLKRYK
jgi:hypothetical protein